MKLIKPSFWQNSNFFAILLYPFSLITYIINYCKKFSKQNDFKIKIICVGNIYIGGTGKTTLAIEIYKLLKKKYKTVFIKKNYKNQKDEIKLLSSKGKVIFHKNRLEALQLAQKKKFSLAVMDDGLQQKNINYDLKIVCFNSTEGLGNAHLLPAGPLRESINEMKYCDIAILNGEKSNNKLKKKLKEVNRNIKIFEGFYEPKNLVDLNKNKKYLMFCGIGNPHEFEKTLLKYKFKIKKKIIFPDHYSFSTKEIKNLRNNAKKNNLNIITTEKDYLRLNKKQRIKINHLKVRLKIKKFNEFKKLLNNI